MNIRSKIIAFQLFFVAVILLMAAVVYFAVGRADLYIERVAHAHRQLETITALSLHANRYSEQIAEMLLFGEEGRAEFEEARQDLESSFAALQEVTEQEIASLSDTDERAGEEAELAVLDGMRQLAAQMHVTALELLELKVIGREDEARLRYFGEIEEDLDDELQRLIDLAIADERSEVELVDSRTRAFTRELLILVVVTLAAVLCASIGAVMLLSRALGRPIGRLTEGAAAIGAGRLGHRIPVSGRDELALLSGHFNDMAEQLEHQRNELLRHQAELELKVGERTAQLAEANRRLKDLDRVRVLFLADVSHELRTPLTVLRGEAEVTLRSRGATSEDYRDTLERIFEQATLMGRLVDDLLFLTRAEADSIRFALAPVALHEVVEEAVDEARTLARQGDSRLRIELPEQIVTVRGDRQRLKQTALIALDNAIKYSPPEALISIALSAEDGRAVLRVHNPGEGIPPEDLPYVFDRFYRGRQQVAGTGGSGLGLAIARWIVEKHGGSIGMTSPGGEGTELEIRLPLLGATSPAQSAPML